jgi:hypothetical protein
MGISILKVIGSEGETEIGLIPTQRFKNLTFLGENHWVDTNSAFQKIGFFWLKSLG